MSHNKLRLLLALPLTITSFVFAEDAASKEAETMMEKADQLPDPSLELGAITDRIVASLRAGKPVDPDDVAALDALMDKYDGVRTEAVAQITLTKATYLLRVVEEVDAALALLQKVMNDVPGTPSAQMAARLAEMVKKEQAKAQRQADFVGSTAPQIDFTWASEGEMKTLSDLRGKVVVLDFWATWCGPCVRSFPQMRQLTDHYEGRDVVVVGVTSLQGKVHGLENFPINTSNDPAREYALMSDYMAKHDINWTVVFSRQKVFNEDYMVEGIPHMAIIAPDGSVRHTGLHPAMPHAEKTKKIDAILKEFNLPLPTKA